MSAAGPGAPPWPWRKLFRRALFWASIHMGRASSRRGPWPAKPASPTSNFQRSRLKARRAPPNAWRLPPVSGLRAMGAALSARGSVFWSEPSGSREPLENRNPQGKLRSSLSPFHCLTVSLAAGGAGLGTIIGEAGARELAAQAGFAIFEKLPIDSPAQQFFWLRDF